MPSPKNPARVPPLLAHAGPVGSAAGSGPGVRVMRSTIMDQERKKAETTGTYKTKEGDSFFLREGEFFPGAADAEFSLVEAAKDEPSPAEKRADVVPQTKAMPAAPQTKSEKA